MTITSERGTSEARAQTRIRTGLAVAMVGGVLWVLSEIVEVIGGGINPPSMALLIAGCVALAVGVPFLAPSLREHWRPLGVVAVGLVSLATALEAVVDTIGWGATDVDEIQARTGLLIPIFGVLLVVGCMLLGAAILRNRTLPRWTGVLLIVAPPFLPLVNVLSLPEVITSASKSAIAIAVIGAAFAARSRLSR